MHPTISLLRDLVAIDSVNPALVPGAAGEDEVGRRVADELRRHRIDVVTVEVEPGRHNVIGVVEGRAPGHTLMLCGHLDTVGVEGMEAPFEPAIKDGRVYGRGSQDMKSGVAAMVGAATTIAGDGGLAAGRLIVAAVVDEEHASRGAERLVEDWTADGAVVTEPTDLAMATAHKGFAWVEVQTRGRAAHGSRPLEGRDAILRMGRVLGRLEAWDRELQSRPEHPLLGTPSLHASIITGGREASVYPDHCRLVLERRTVAREAEGVALREVESMLETLRADDPELVAEATLQLERPPHEVPPSDDLVRAMGAVVTRHGLSATPGGMSFWTDAAILAGAGIPSLLFGPSGRGLHSREEFVEVDSVLQCEQVLVDLCEAFCPRPS